MMLTLKGKVAIITGSTRGIGLAIAEKLAQAGASIVCCSSSEGKSQDIAQAIHTQFGVPTLGIQTDISHYESTEQLIKKTIDTFGKIDILVKKT